MAGNLIADTIQAASTSTLVLKNGVANTPPTIQDSAGTQIGTFCRAWVNFNGTGTVAIRAAFNVSSITDNGTGNYTLNFTNAMPDANYCISGFCNFNQTTANAIISANSTYAPSTTSVSVQAQNSTSTSVLDPTYVNVAIFR